jgi:hypothetical protein
LLPDSCSTFFAHSAMKFFGIGAAAGRNWCTRSVTVCATAAVVKVANAANPAISAPARMEMVILSSEAWEVPRL